MNNSIEERFATYCKSFNYDIIPPEFRNKWCIMFGSRLFDSASTFEEALKKHDDLREHNISTFIIAPKELS